MIMESTLELGNLALGGRVRPPFTPAIFLFIGSPTEPYSKSSILTILQTHAHRLHNSKTQSNKLSPVTQSRIS